jgi:hypothetical protein
MYTGSLNCADISTIEEMKLSNWKKSTNEINPSGSMP